ncbi:MAG TPA: class I SAM-dependent methyltransferase [Gammaproteobacteria bacterium]|nr:class I SAM-dependent methyltransferase [Gammaproteobacteria bacterium]
MEPADYEAWYRTERGGWIAEREHALMQRLLAATPGQTLLDVGCGTGHFSRRFATDGLIVTGIDPDAAMLAYARAEGGPVSYIQGDALALPFAAASFDYCAAVTSLCFIPAPAAALAEMWRVCRRGVLLGLLNRHSLLYRRKAGRGGYRGARWDTAEAVEEWAQSLSGVAGIETGTAIHLPGGGPVARLLETVVGSNLPWGAFLAARIARAERP